MSILKPVHKAIKPQSFSLLYLSEGFQNIEQEKNDFQNLSILITESLFKLFPFNYNKRYISVWAKFSPSQDSNIGEITPKDTAFNFYLNNNNLVTNSPEKILGALTNIDVEVTSICNDKQIMRGEDIWRNPALFGRRVICVICKYHTTLSNVYINLDDNWSHEHEQNLNSLLPFIAITTGTNTINNPYDRNAASLARELGRVAGLFYENEKPTEEFKTFPEEDELGYPNIATHKDIYDEQNRLVKENIPWIELIDKQRQDNQAQIYDHPQKNASAEAYAPILEASHQKIVILKHLQDETGPIEPNIDYFTGGKSILSYMSPNLIEGGAYYLSDIYRSNTECLMRKEGRVINNKWITTPFCRVCQNAMIKMLGGISNFSIGQIKIPPQPLYIRGLTCFSKLGEKFVEHIQKTENNFNVNPRFACIAATLKRYKTFFENELKWTNLESVPISLKTEVEGKKWAIEQNARYNEQSNDYKTIVKYPIGAHPKAKELHYIWSSNLKQLRAIKNLALRPYAGLGAVGVLLMSGFGSLVNQHEEIPRKIGNNYYYFLNTLSEEDWDNLPPGSLLQCWRSKTLYEEIIKCTNRVIRLDEVQINDDDGHSLIFMGNVNGMRVVADQTRVNADLGSSWQGGYEFWIAGRWAYGTNID